MRVGLLTCLLLPSSFEAAVAQDILGIDRRERFRIDATGEHRPSFAYPGSVKVGTVLPDDGGGVSYDVPPEFALPAYNDTVVNDHPVPVDPRTRRVVEVVDRAVSDPRVVACCRNQPITA